MQRLRRFEEHKVPNPRKVKGLREDHPALVEGRTIYPETLRHPSLVDRLLVSGMNNRKIGGKIVKGPWKGCPVYTLSLEERATCPRSCEQWRICYGNAMPYARRHIHGPALEKRLQTELASLDAFHQNGFVVRLHVLGDFYRLDYVRAWNYWLSVYKALRVYGYTAHPPGSEIGKAIARLNDKHDGRCFIRFSGRDTKVIDYLPARPVVEEGTVCPAQTGGSDCCGTCGLCWSPAFKSKTVVFIKHGKSQRGWQSEFNL